jgi:hypothetical protein
MKSKDVENRSFHRAGFFDYNGDWPGFPFQRAIGRLIHPKAGRILRRLERPDPRL